MRCIIAQRAAPETFRHFLLDGSFLLHLPLSLPRPATRPDMPQRHPVTGAIAGTVSHRVCVDNLRAYPRHPEGCHLAVLFVVVPQPAIYEGTEPGDVARPLATGADAGAPCVLNGAVGAGPWVGRVHSRFISSRACLSAASIEIPDSILIATRSWNKYNSSSGNRRISSDCSATNVGGKSCLRR